MSYVLTVTNQKGGVGKTTTAAALASGAKLLLGKRVLAVDLDPQCNLSLALGGDLSQELPNVRDALDRRLAVRECVQALAQCDLLPSTLGLAGADRRYTDMGATFRLREALESVSDDYDLVVIDTPPTLGVLTLMALTASDGTLIPLNTDAFSIQAVGQLLETVETVRKYSNPALSVIGYAITRYDGRSRASKDYRDAIADVADKTGIPLLASIVREGVAAREATGSGVSIFEQRSRQSDDYESLLREVAGKVWSES